MSIIYSSSIIDYIIQTCIPFQQVRADPLTTMVGRSLELCWNILKRKKTRVQQCNLSNFLSHIFTMCCADVILNGSTSPCRKLTSIFATDDDRYRFARYHSIHDSLNGMRRINRQLLYPQLASFYILSLNLRTIWMGWAASAWRFLWGVALGATFVAITFGGKLPLPYIKSARYVVRDLYGASSVIIEVADILRSVCC